jgi:GT2 family glycosyltransferase
VILGYGQFKATTQLCLESLIQDLGREDVQFTVIDNGSPDDSAHVQEEFVQPYPILHSVLLPKNLGYAGGMNYGVSLFDATWVLLLGSDTILQPNAFEILYQALKQMDENVGVVGPVTNEAGTCQKLDFKSTLPQDIFAEFSQRSPETTQLQIPMYRADFFCVAIRKSLWDALGGLDLSYGRGYYEDFDFCMKANAMGFQTVMLQNAFVFHQGSASFQHDPAQSELIKKNKGIFLNKFPNAELRHRRLDLYLAIQQDLMRKCDSDMRAFIIQLSKLRIESLRLDLPKSPMKKLIWKSKITAISKKLTQFKT